MNRSTIWISIIILAIITTAATLLRPTETASPKRLTPQQAPPTPISSHLDNSMSSFEQTKGFDREVESFMRRWEFKGASFALMRNDSLLYAKGYGYANDTLKCNVNNCFRVASISKLLTATAIMKLIEQGRLSLDAQIFGEEGILNDSLFLDLYSMNHKLITIEHLLRHTAGFSSPHGDPAFATHTIARIIDRPLPLTINDMVYYATRTRLRTRPGDNYDYSNLGYIVLTKIIEERTAQSYETYLQDSILAPIGCHGPYIGKSFREELGPNEVQYYEVKEATEVEAYDGSGRMTMKSDGGNNIPLLSGAGGWVATPTELLRLVASINNEGAKEDLLTPETIKTMTYDSRHDKPIGWATVRRGEWLRSGSMAGTSALIKHQEDGYTWIFVVNNSAWIGPRISNYISSHISRAIAKVKQWPERDLFTFEGEAL
ncbi:MAG: serine hydrolase domain-containing protein [Rikenellaceae bacterium]